MAIVRTKTQWGLLISFLILLFLLPLFAGDRLLHSINLTAITVVALLGLQILTGYCGQISIGHAAFMAIGAYASAVLVVKADLPFMVALPCAGLAAGLVGLLFGLPSLRVKGFYLALATLAAQFIIMYIISHWDLTGGIQGLSAPPPSIGGIEFYGHQLMFYIIMVVTVIMTITAKNLARTKAGRAFIAIRDNDTAAEGVGVSLYRYKLLAFFVGCSYAGIAGALWAHYINWIEPGHFPLLNSVWYLGFLVIGVLGSIMGALYGAAFMRILEQLVITFTPTLPKILPFIPESNIAAFAQVAYGVIIVLFLIFEPRGLAYRWELIKAYYRLWPAAR